MTNGALAGYQMDSMKITLKDGSFHPVDSDQLSFEIAARNGYRAAAPKAGSVILEPIMSVEVVTPEENMGDIIGDLNKRRGQVTGMESKGTARVVKAKVPLSEMFGYVTCCVRFRRAAPPRPWSSRTSRRFPPTWQRRSSRKRVVNVRIRISKHMNQKIRIKLKSFDHNSWTSRPRRL